jgi:hypothetical protein
MRWITSSQVPRNRSPNDGEVDAEHTLAFLDRVG